MVGFALMTRLEQARAYYLDAYKDAWGHPSPELPSTKWDSVEWLEDAVDSLADGIAVHKFIEENQYGN